MPIGGPPGVRQQAESIVPLSQKSECARGIGIDRRPAGDRLRVAVHRAEKLGAAYRNTEAVEGLAHESRRRSAPVFGVDPSPVVAFGLAHGTDIRVAGGPPPISE